MPGPRCRAGTLALVVALSALVGARLVLAAAPADAGITVTTLYPHESPLTWVADDGSQYVVASVLTSISAPSGAFDLVVGHVLADGTPDAAWGTYDGGYDHAIDVGVRPLVLDPPDEGLHRTFLAVDDHGVLTATWGPTGCNSGVDSCTTWFSRHDASGAQVSEPVLVAATTQRPTKALTDGSVLTTDATAAPGWRGPDGTDLGFPDLEGASVTDATVDHTGRLLVSTSANRVVRWPAGGPADLDLDVTTCPAGAGVRLARSTVDDSFATICTPSEARLLKVERRDDTGEIEWSAAPPALQPEGQMAGTSNALVDDTGRVWVGGSGPQLVAPSQARAEFLQSFTADDVSAPVAWRDATRESWYEFEPTGFAQLRDAPGADIAYIAELSCCRHPVAGDSPQSSVDAARVAPAAVAPPTCVATDVTLSEVTRTSAHLHFRGCSITSSDTTHQPTGYRIGVQSGDQPPIITDLPVSSGLPPFDQDVALTPGVLSRITITPTDRAGAGTPASTTTLRLVAPFPTVEAFVDRQIHDLLRSPDEVPRLAVIASVRNGSTPPVELVDGWLTGRLSRSGNDVQPVARLYEAFFQRGADATGLPYWVGRRLRGQRLGQAADRFAASPEFLRRYGSLSNTGFVAQLYRNVFGREADPSGLAHWTKKLDTRSLSRGGVVTQLSESSEHLRRSARFVEPLAARYLMVGRVSSATQRATWAAAADPQAAAVVDTLSSESYATTVAG